MDINAAIAMWLEAMADNDGDALQTAHESIQVWLLCGGFASEPDKLRAAANIMRGLEPYKPTNRVTDRIETK